MKKNKGITLIALVITIIVLLILAGVALSLVAGNEGILTKAETAVTETNIASAKEQAELMAAELSADYYKKRYVDRDANVANQTVAEYIKAQVGAGKTSSNGDYVVKVDDSGKLTVSDKTGVVIAEGNLEESGKVSWSESAGGSGESAGGDDESTGGDDESTGGDGESTGGNDESTGGNGESDEGETETAGLYKDDGTFIPWATLIEEGTLTVTNGMVRCNDTTIAGRLELDKNVINIEPEAFKGCTNLSSINIPSGVTRITMEAFRGCENLSSINIPESVTRIDGSAFYGCTSLSSINIPDSVTSIGQSAFEECTSLSSINIPDGVTSIGYNVFYGCTSLSSINIPESVTSIGNSAFYNCTSLSSINIPESVTTIEGYAFARCTNLTTVTIDSSTIASGLTSQVSSYYLIYYATTIYIKSGLTVGSYVTTNFTESTSDKEGYVMYTK